MVDTRAQAAIEPLPDIIGVIAGVGLVVYGQIVSELPILQENMGIAISIPVMVVLLGILSREMLRRLPR